MKIKLKIKLTRNTVVNKQVALCGSVIDIENKQEAMFLISIKKAEIYIEAPQKIELPEVENQEIELPEVRKKKGKPSWP
jgi:hypothetical protein